MSRAFEACSIGPYCRSNYRTEFVLNFGAVLEFYPTARTVAWFELNSVHRLTVRDKSIGENIDVEPLVVMQLRELGIETIVETIVAKAVTPLHGRILGKLGVSRVIFPEREMAIRIAHSLVMPNVIDYIELSRDFSIVEVPAPDAFIGRTLKQLELRPRLGLTLIAIKHQSDGGAGMVTNIAPAADETIREGDVLALLAAMNG